MEHMAWKGRIKPGCKAEYQRRHAEIWPEMVKVLKDAGERAKHRYAGKSPRCLWQRGLLPCQTIYSAPSERTLS